MRSLKTAKAERGDLRSTVPVGLNCPTKIQLIPLPAAKFDGLTKLVEMLRVSDAHTAHGTIDSSDSFNDWNLVLTPREV